jgi:long-chain acyl-CoA synthetase
LLLEKFKDLAGQLPSLKVLGCGGSLLTREDYFRIKSAFNTELLHGYGLTEFTPVSRNSRGEAKAGTVGPLSEDIQCKIIPEDENGAGEILIKTRHMFRGYYKNPKITKEAFEGDWFKTGDIGKIMDDHLVFVREKKRTRNANGNMIDLKELDRIAHMIDKKNRSDLRTSLKDEIAAYKIPFIDLK